MEKYERIEDEQKIISNKLDKIYIYVKRLVHNPTPIQLPLSKEVPQGDDKERVTDDEQEEKYILNEVNLLKVHGKDPFKYALTLMDILFTNEQMASTTAKKSKK